MQSGFEVQHMPAAKARYIRLAVNLSMRIESSWVTKATSLSCCVSLFNRVPIVVAETQMLVQTEDLPSNVAQATQNQRRCM